jgi:hypothetical protein
MERGGGKRVDRKMFHFAREKTVVDVLPFMLSLSTQHTSLPPSMTSSLQHATGTIIVV